MTEIQRYVVTQDTNGLFREINPNIELDSTHFPAEADQYFVQLQEQLRAMFGDSLEVAGFSEAEIERRLLERVTPLMQDPNSICLCLDRFLLNTLEQDEELSSRFVRFGICRTAQGERVPRQTMPSFEDQITELHLRFPDLQNRNVIVVDDGLFSGQTVERVREMFSNNGDTLHITNIIGFIGNTDLVDEGTLAVSEVLQPEPNLYDWVDIRDLGPLGGRMLARSRGGNVSSAVPYLYPWSDGRGASLQDSPALFETSLGMIRSFRDLVERYQEVATNGEPVTIKDLVKAGYPFPTDLAKTIPIRLGDTLVDYLARCEERVIAEQNREVAIFDMDGTLYELNGGNGFTGSLLEQAIEQRALQFICQREGITPEQALPIMNAGLADPVGLSNFLAQRYSISRNEYFDFAWDIDPEGIVENFEFSGPVIEAFKQANPQRKLVLLTSAPRVWTERVLQYIGVQGQFEELYTGERYKTKQDIFQTLSGRYRAENVISVGDQIHTDIEPAAAVGFNTLHVRTPADLQLLIQS